MDKFEGCLGWLSLLFMVLVLLVKGFLWVLLSVDVEDVGVRLGDWLEVFWDEGEVVLFLEFLFFLEDLLGFLFWDSY